MEDGNEGREWEDKAQLIPAFAGALKLRSMSNNAISSNWEELKLLLTWFLGIFGDPKRLYEDHYVRRAHGLVVRGWIAGLEAVTRALLVQMAAALPKPTALPARRAHSAPLGKPKPAAPPDHAPLTDNNAGAPPEIPDSERWTGVSFVLLPPGRSIRIARPAQRLRRAPSAVMAVRPLAYRLEALIRVVAKPERYAERMSQKLHADPRSIGRALRKTSAPGCRSFPCTDVDAAQADARLAGHVFQANTG